MYALSSFVSTVRSQVTALARLIGMSARPRCAYGADCTRKNPQHIADFDHTPGPPMIADASAPHCPYAHNCFRVNAAHRAEMYHAPAPKVRPISAFPTPFEEADYGSGAKACLQARTLRELDMMRLMGAIKEKPEWFTKVHDAEITGRWSTEAAAQFESLTTDSIAWCIAELKYQATTRVGPIQPAAVDGVWQADGLISEELKSALLTGVQRLENVPEEQRDWHPGTNKQVLDLVHPSLYCYVIGQSRVTNDQFGVAEALDKIGQGEPEAVSASSSAAPAVGAKRRNKGDYCVSERFQWLPAEFSLSDDGSKAVVESYINNLHPREEAALYPVIGDIFAKFVPMFESVLTHIKTPPSLRIIPDAYGWYDKPKTEGDPDDAAEEGELDEDDDDYYENRPIYIPDVRVEFVEPDPLPADRLVKLAGRRLQVIVKLANIHLTPENPTYAGGSWHVEGMKNENIVASGIYYFASENISESKLAFRQACEEPEYEQSDNRGVRLVYGLGNEEALNQPLGSVITQADRCIAFPNLYQHQVQPFKLTDATRPGHRKILVFFLVDPSLPIASSATVPPQQAHWLRTTETPFHRALLDATPLIDPIVREVLAYSDLGVISRKQAEAQREQLMEERKYFVTQNNELLFEREFSLCEH